MESTNLLHDRLHDLDLALQVGDHDSALRHARDLRAGADSICMRLMPIVIEECTRLVQTECNNLLQAEECNSLLQTLPGEVRATVPQSCEVAK